MDEMEVEDVTEKYECFIKANADAAEKLVPKQRREKKEWLSDDPKINDARKDVESAFASFKKKPNPRTQKKLQTAYLEAEEAAPEKAIGEVESADMASRHIRRWRLINNITGRRNSRQGIIKGSSKEERVKRLYDHFRNLLGNEPASSEVEDEDIEVVVEDPGIDDGNFTMSDQLPEKNSLTRGQTGPDQVSPAALK